MITLRKNEEILLIKRRHHFILIRALLLTTLVFLALVLLMIILFFVSFEFPDWITNIFPFLLGYRTRLLALYLISLALLIIWQVAFIAVATYYLDCWIVTTERTIHTELRSLFSRILSSVPHHRIQDVTVDVKGILPTLLRYGDLQIQTAGKFHEFIFKEIPDPYKTKEIIFKAQKMYFRRKMKQRENIPEEKVANN